MSMRTAGLGLAAILAAMTLAPVPGSAAPLVVDKGAQASYWRNYDRGTYVRAPFSEVDTRGDTWVAAPFVRVYNGPAGTWVRAPFVNRWIPR